MTSIFNTCTGGPNSWGGAWMVSLGGSGCGGRLGDWGALGVCLSDADDGCWSLEISWEKEDSAVPVFPSPTEKERSLFWTIYYRITQTIPRNIDLGTSLIFSEGKQCGMVNSEIKCVQWFGEKRSNDTFIYWFSKIFINFEFQWSLTCLSLLYTQ